MLESDLGMKDKGVIVGKSSSETLLIE